MPQEQQIWDALSTVMDPETNLNIVEMGLVYSVDLQGDDVEVKMTLTTPGCPMSSTLVKGATEAIDRVEGVGQTHVDLVWDPPWTMDMLAPHIKEQMARQSRGCS